MNITTLIEEIGDWRADVSVESEQRLVRNVALTGRESRNGYRYSRLVRFCISSQGGLIIVPRGQPAR